MTNKLKEGCASDEWVDSYRGGGIAESLVTRIDFEKSRVDAAEARCRELEAALNDARDWVVDRHADSAIEKVLSRTPSQALKRAQLRDAVVEAAKEIEHAWDGTHEEQDCTTVGEVKTAALGMRAAETK